jgi:predicted Zn-dependent protease with MMP-like domain
MPFSRPPAGDRASKRARRHADREVRRVLSESRSIAIWVFFIVSSHVSGFALLAGNGRLALVAGALAFGAFIALSARAEPVPDRGPKGAIATMPEPAFEVLVQHVEHAADDPGPAGAEPADTGDAIGDDEFAQLVRAALDDLPLFMRFELERNIAVVIADDGELHGAYGMYVGGTVARRSWCDRIIIYRDTLTRDYGGAPDALRRMVTMVVQHELAHHLGASERRVAELGLSDLRGRSPSPEPCDVAATPAAPAMGAVAESRRPPAGCGPPIRARCAAMARRATHKPAARAAGSCAARPQRRAARNVRSRARAGGLRGPPRRSRRACR